MMILIKSALKLHLILWQRMKQKDLLYRTLRTSKIKSGFLIFQSIFEPEFDPFEFSISYCEVNDGVKPNVVNKGNY